MADHAVCFRIKVRQPERQGRPTMKFTSSRLILLQLIAFSLLPSALPAADLDGQPLPDVVLVDFASSYCAPCRQMVPLLRNMENDGFPIRKIDTTEKPHLSRQYNVQLLPTLIVMVEGKEVQRFEGFTDERTLRRAVNRHAEELHARRTAQTASLPTPAVNPESANTETRQPKSGLAGFFDRFRSSADPEPRTTSTDTAAVRAQSPDESPTDQQRQSIPHRATVRVRLMDGKIRDVGTGTVIHSEPGKSLILTCAHIFKDAKADAVIEVDVFDDDKILKYSAEVLGGDHNADVALLSIKTTRLLPAAEVAFDRTKLQPRDSLFSIGCSNGDPPTRLKMMVIEVNRFEGPATILCTNAPTQGRSGGGLFDENNRIVGICSAADYKAGEGLYCGLPPLQKLMKKLNLTSLKSSVSPGSPDGQPAPRIAGEETSPFPSDEGVFDALFSRDSTTQPSLEEPGVEVADFGGMSFESSGAMPASLTTQTSLADPFGESGSVNSAAMMPQSTAEVTVIIKDASAPNGRRVVVIPKASPWLLKLLTGKSAPGSSQVSTTATGGSDSSAPVFE